MHLIGIHGAAGSGKDTLANMLAHVHLVKRGGQFYPLRGHGSPDPICGVGSSVILALADPMKVFLQDMGVPEGMLWGPSSKRNKEWFAGMLPRAERYRSTRAYRHGRGLSVRILLQTLGTEWGRSHDESLWIDVLRDNMVAWADSRWEDPRDLTVVIPDVRFANEALAIFNAGGRVVQLTRSGAGLTGAAGAHVSEHPDPEFKRYVTDEYVNDGTLDDLRAFARTLKRGP